MRDFRTAASRTEVSRRFSDVGPYGHVNSVAYFNYLQEARWDLLQSLERHHAGPFPSVVVEQRLTYRKQLRLTPAPLIVHSWIETVGTSSFSVAQRILDEYGDVAAEGSCVLVLTDAGTSRSIPMTADARATLELLKVNAQRC